MTGFCDDGDETLGFDLQGLSVGSTGRPATAALEKLSEILRLVSVAMET
jgi:hypothetical protein